LIEEQEAGVVVDDGCIVADSPIEQTYLMIAIGKIGYFCLLLIICVEFDS